MGPVGVGVGLADVVEVIVELPVPVGLLVVLVLVDRFEFNLYAFKRLRPPQYSEVLPLQVMEQPFCVGLLPPAARAEPALKLLPQ